VKYYHLTVGAKGQGGLKVLHLWHHSQKTCTPKQNNFFRVETTRLAASFDASTRSVTRTGAAIFPRKATCIVFFSENPRKQPDAKELREKHSTTYYSLQTSLNTIQCRNASKVKYMYACSLHCFNSPIQFFVIILLSLENTRYHILITLHFIAEMLLVMYCIWPTWFSFFHPTVSCYNFAYFLKRWHTTVIVTFHHKNAVQVFYPHYFPATMHNRADPLWCTLPIRAFCSLQRSACL